MAKIRTVESESLVESLDDKIERIRADAEYKSYRKLVDRHLEKIDLEAVKQEVLSMHGVRESRGLYGKKIYDAEALRSAILCDLSSRSRMVEVRARMGLHVSYIEAAIDSIRKYIYMAYAKSDASMSTETTRKSFVDTLIKDDVRELQAVRAVMDLTDTLIKDIDQAAFGLRNALESTKLLSETRGKII